MKKKVKNFFFLFFKSYKSILAKMSIKEVQALVQQAFPLIDGKPEMVFEGESI